jgi:hypothetical protein
MHYQNKNHKRLASLMLNCDMHNDVGKIRQVLIKRFTDLSEIKKFKCFYSYSKYRNTFLIKSNELKAWKIGFEIQQKIHYNYVKKTT